jgi:crotonobetainyl-CoA:carnitine CoA-transferase CaiB-like acyl-CoA transferase
MVGETDHPTLGRLRTLGSPLKMSATPTDATRSAPLLGEHTRDVLLESGYSDREIDALLKHRM